MNYTKFEALIDNHNRLLQTDLIAVDVMNILQIEDIEFDTISIVNNNIKYKKNVHSKELLIKNIANKMDKITIRFFNCKFNNKIQFFKVNNYSFIFEECEFNTVEFHGIASHNHPDYKEYKSNFEFIAIKKINKLKILNSNFSGRFYINDQKYTEEQISISNVTIRESAFNKNFKLHNCKVATVNLDGVDFKKNADFFKSIFINGYSYRKEDNRKDIIFNGINVDGLTIFEECVFYNKFILKYVTFNGLAQFRKTEFFKGFDLDRTNSEKEMNFYGVNGLDKDESIENTSQETYRIIKYNCERIGSIIDGNKYHALELEKRKEKLNKNIWKKINIYIHVWSCVCLYRNNKLKNTFKIKKQQQRGGLILDAIVFNLNWKTSNFGTNWISPLFGILLVGFTTLLLLHFGSILTLFEKQSVSEFISYGWKGFNQAFSYMYILNKDFVDDGVIFLLNKIFLGYLYYQFVTAVRKDTRK